VESSGAGPSTDVLALAFVAIAALLVVLHRRGVARVLWREEDPRTMAALRIATGLCTLGWALDLWPLVDYLFSDEGLFLRETARQVHFAEAFAGVGDGSAPDEAVGFFDGTAFVHWLAGHGLSPLFFWDSPVFARGVWLALVVSTIALVLGWRTTVAKWSTFALLLALVDRNRVFLAGEQLIASCLLVVCCARCDRAWAIDAPRDRLVAIPAWPRVLGLLSLLPLFFVNGLVKTGDGWAEGRTLHYLLVHPDYARWEPSWITPTISLWMLRPATWTVHAFELLYPLVVIGTIVRWHRSAGGSRAVSPAQRVGWIALAVCGWLLADAALPDDARWRLSGAVASLGVIAVVIAAITRRSFGLSAIAPWILGRRVLCTLQVVFTGTLIAMTDLGWFVPLALATVLLHFEGDELARAVDRVRRRATPPSILEPAAPVRSRPAIAWFVACSVLAGLVVQLPAPPPESSRATLEQPLRVWLAWTHASQHYQMFAPDGPIAAFDLRAMMVDADDNLWTIDSGLAPRHPWTFSWGRDKSRKSASRMLGEEAKWYRKWHGRWLCRERVMIDGVLPRRVALFRVRRKMQTPAGDSAGPVAIDQIWEGACATEVHGQPPPRVRERHGLALAEPFVPWVQRRAARWEERRDAGEVPRWPWVPIVVIGPLVVAAIRRRR
jgi:hypothetical protein